MIVGIAPEKHSPVPIHSPNIWSNMYLLLLSIFVSLTVNSSMTSRDSSWASSSPSLSQGSCLVPVPLTSPSALSSLGPLVSSSLSSSSLSPSSFESSSALGVSSSSSFPLIQPSPRSSDALGPSPSSVSSAACSWALCSDVLPSWLSFIPSSVIIPPLVCIVRHRVSSWVMPQSASVLVSFSSSPPRRLRHCRSRGVPSWSNIFLLAAASVVVGVTSIVMTLPGVSVSTNRLIFSATSSIRSDRFLAPLPSVVSVTLTLDCAASSVRPLASNAARGSASASSCSARCASAKRSAARSFSFAASVAAWVASAAPTHPTSLGALSATSSASNASFLASLSSRACCSRSSCATRSARRLSCSAAYAVEASSRFAISCSCSWGLASKFARNSAALASAASRSATFAWSSSRRSPTLASATSSCPESSSAPWAVLLAASATPVAVTLFSSNCCSRRNSCC